MSSCLSALNCKTTDIREGCDLLACDWSWHVVGVAYSTGMWWLLTPQGMQESTSCLPLPSTSSSPPQVMYCPALPSPASRRARVISCAASYAVGTPTVPFPIAKALSSLERQLLLAKSQCPAVQEGPQEMHSPSTPISHAELTAEAWWGENIVPGRVESICDT